MNGIDEHMVYGSGFKAGLEAAAKMHDDMAEVWRKCASDILPQFTQREFLESIKIHENYASMIRELTEKE